MKQLVVPFLLALLLAGHFLWLEGYVVAAHASPDADGYFAQARLLATQGRVTYRAESPMQYIGFHWLEAEEGRFISRYPPGLPLLLAAAWRIGGPEAAFGVNAALATATLLALFLLCRPWVGGGLALAAALVFAVHPLANRHALHADAHTAAAFFLVGGLWLLDAWGRRPAGWKAFFAGLALGVVPCIRFAEAAAGLGAALFLALQLPRLAGKRRQVLWALLGAAIPVGLQLAYNHYGYGAFWRTGYSLTNEQQLSWEDLRRNCEPFLDALATDGAGLFFAFGLAGLGTMLVQRAARPLAACLAAAIAGITGVYAGYYFSSGPGMGWLRFLLPTLPLYLLPAMWYFRLLGGGRVMAAGLFILVAIQLGRGVPDSLARLEMERAGARRSAAAIEWLAARVPRGSILVADRPVHEQIHFTGYWRLADKSLILGRDRGREPGAGPLPADDERPNPAQREKAAGLRRRYAGLRPDERAMLAATDLWAWAGKESAIYWIGSRAEAAELRRLTHGVEELEALGRIELPALEEPEPARERPGGMPGAPGVRRPPMGGRFGLPPGLPLEVFRMRR